MGRLQGTGNPLHERRYRQKAAEELRTFDFAGGVVGWVFVNGGQAMREHLTKLVNDMADVLVLACLAAKADQAEFEILAGELRRAFHAATCAARVRYWHELNAKEGGEG
jgi:rhamnogalacturonyl hydrolase YesR